MKRSAYLPITVIVLMSLACGLFGSPQTTTITTDPPAVTEAVILEAEQAEATSTSAQPTVEMPTSTPEPAATNTPEPAATEAPTDTPLPPQPSFYEETFDQVSKNWSDDYVVTTQAIGGNLKSKGVIQDGVLHFRMDDKETYMYKFFTPSLAGDVSIEAEYQSKGNINNGISLVCRVNDDRTSWFEVRVSSTSDFMFFRYDKRIRDEQGKNPYVLLGKGKFKIDELYPTKPNTFKITCLEDEIILETNLGARIVSQALESSLDGSYVGIGVISYDVLPVTIDFDRITIQEE